MVSDARKARINKAIEHHHAGRAKKSQEWLDEAKKVLTTGKPTDGLPLLPRKK